MSTHRPQPDEVEQLLLNARLRDELEPFFDEAILHINSEQVPTSVENEFLASMLAWEKAPVLPIAQWFEPELQLPHPDLLSDAELHEVLWNAIDKLFAQRIVLDFTDHLSDRELYTVIYRDILPSPEKRIESHNNFLHWDCADMGGDPEIWLKYYASEEERAEWAADLPEPLPEPAEPPFPRELPREPS